MAARLERRSPTDVRPPSPLAALFKDVTGATRKLMHDQAALARVEARIASRAVVTMITGGVVLGLGWVAVCIALCFLLSPWLAPPWTALIIGAVHVLGGGIMTLWGRARMDVVSRDPPGAAQSLAEPAPDGWNSRQESTQWKA